MDQEFIIALTTAVLAGLGGLARQWAKTALTPRRLESLGDLVHIVVAAAEEVGRVFDLDSGAKYDYAENALRDAAKTLGLRLSDAELNAYIHALLYSTNVNTPTWAEAPDEVEEPEAA